ncbi:MAG: ATP-binding cassette domain-containing protein, partial [Planctomycetes bacterium]|nr:ATP-binding cassette domain-containing protein [Planctomycetota bacterium]
MAGSGCPTGDDDGAAIRMTGITKRYPRVIANRNVSLEAARGEVHAVVGENGAGKSTLMKILYGLVRADEGAIEVLGRRLVGHSPSQAIEAGVGMVFQHFMLIPSLTVAENVVLGMEPTRARLFYDRAAAVTRIREVSRLYGLDVDPEARVENCSVGVQQRVEILKVLARGGRVMILDEPTAVLTPQEVDELIAVLRRLANQGRTILLITHKLREVMAASDRVTVMRAGEVVATLQTSRTSAGEIAHLMVGRDIESPKRPPARPAGRVVLEVRNLRAMCDRGMPALRDVSLEVREGEIVGVAGVEGNGQTELVECIAGLRRPASGSVRVDGGLAHIPEDRRERGIVPDFSFEENAIL